MNLKMIILKIMITLNLNIRIKMSQIKQNLRNDIKAQKNIQKKKIWKEVEIILKTLVIIIRVWKLIY